MRLSNAARGVSAARLTSPVFTLAKCDFIEKDKAKSCLRKNTDMCLTSRLSEERMKGFVFFLHIKQEKMSKEDVGVHAKVKFDLEMDKWNL